MSATQTITIPKETYDTLVAAHERMTRYDEHRRTRQKKYKQSARKKKQLK
jgi:hypothetical protein